MDNVLPSNLIHAVEMTGGQIFMTPGIEVLLSSKLTLLLPTVMRSPFHLYEKSIVVYQKSHFNVIGELIDEFTTDLHLKGDMAYTVICNSVERLIPTANCERLSNIGEKIFCVNTTTLTSKKVETKWKFRFEDRRTMDQLNCSTIVTVRLDKDVRNLITLRGWLSNYRIYPRQNVLVIYAEVMQDGMPVTDAQVTADIYSSTDGPPISVKLWDTGNGDPDTYKGDGIYSKYFTQIHEKGMHLVVLRAAQDPMKIINDENTMKSATGFTRITVVGSFEVIEKPPNVDLYPPSRIGDLKVVGVNHTMPSATLQWTAPGGDYDHGTAMKYEVKYSLYWSELTEIAFAFTTVDSHMCTVENKKQEHQSGSVQSYSLQLPTRDRDVLYYIALRALDVTNNEGKVSNIVQVFTKVNSSQNGLKPTYDDNNTSPKNGMISSSTMKTSYEINATVSMDFNLTLLTKAPLDENTTSGPITSTKYECKICDDPQDLLILVAAISSGVLVTIIVVNILVWLICFRKNKKPNNLTRNTPLRPPHNITIAYSNEPKSLNFISSPINDLCNDHFDDGLDDFEIDCDYTFISNNNQQRHTQAFNNYEPHNANGGAEMATIAYRNSSFTNNGKNTNSGRAIDSYHQSVNASDAISNHNDSVITLGYI